MFETFAKLDPLLQVVAIFSLTAVIVITCLRLRRYLQKRRKRRREKIWVTY